MRQTKVMEVNEEGGVSFAQKIQKGKKGVYILCLLDALEPQKKAIQRQILCNASLGQTKKDVDRRK
jgi:ribosomal protein S6